MALIVRTPDTSADAAAVHDHLLAQVESSRISKYAVPEIDRITFVSEIPKTSVGKIDKKVLGTENNSRRGCCRRSACPTTFASSTAH